MSGTTTKTPTMTVEQQEAFAQETARVNGILQRARSGDESAVPELQQLLNKRPELWASTPDLQQCTLHTWATTIAGSDFLLREAIIRDYRIRVHVLMSRNPCQMEQMLANQVGFFRLQLLHAETVLGQMASGGFSKASDTVDKRITAAQKRLSRAQNALLTYQKAHGLTPLSKPVASPPKRPGSGLDPVQRAAAEILADAKTKAAREHQAVTTDQPTEVPLRPPIAGTERMVTSESMLADNEVPNDSVFSALVGASLTGSAPDRESEKLASKKRRINRMTGRERVTL